MPRYLTGGYMTQLFHKDTFDRIPEEKRTRILEIATTEFANKGFDNANINDIAQIAGISVGSLYKYFDSKENFFLTCIRYGQETLENVLSDALESKEDILIKAEKIVRHIQMHSRQNRDLIRLYNEITSESNSALVKKLSRDLEMISAHAYTTLIQKAKDEGEIRDDIDPKLYAFFTDSLFMMLQFSYTCEYYQERFKIYAGDDILDRDEAVVTQFMRFLKAAFK
jgi:AcrR family transcriptional regulator